MFSSMLLAIVSLLVLILIHRIYRIFYDIYLHPLAHVQGPKLAAITLLYQTYYSLIGGSRFYIQIGKLHEECGPVVRITSNEVHLSDPENYDKIYYVGSSYFKAKHYYEAMSGGSATFATISNEEYRRKRAKMSPFFSRSRILELEDIVQTNTHKLLVLVAKNFAENKAMELHHGFRAVSVDIITDYAFNRCYNLLDSPDLGENYIRMWDNLGPTMWIFQQWPVLITVANTMPEWMAATISGPLAHLSHIKQHYRQIINTVQADVVSGHKSAAQKTIFHDLLIEDKDYGYVVPLIQHLTDEAFAIDTTGNATTVATIEVTSDRKMYSRLVVELKTALPDENMKLDFPTLEKLPYLTGVIKEAIRISFGDPGKLSREVPAPGATFNGIFAPPGSYISMSTWDLHPNKDYFPDPMKFDPDRWAAPQNAKRMEKAFVPFGKGSAACIGINLAYCELYVVLGNLFRRFDNMVGNGLKPEDRVYNDYISARTPATATKFCVRPGGKFNGTEL